MSRNIGFKHPLIIKDYLSPTRGDIRYGGVGFIKACRVEMELRSLTSVLHDIGCLKSRFNSRGFTWVGWQGTNFLMSLQIFFAGIICLGVGRFVCWMSLLRLFTTVVLSFEIRGTLEIHGGFVIWGSLML